MSRKLVSNNENISVVETINVLIIDDNERITNMLTMFLDSKNFKCTAVNDAKEGMNLIENNFYDVVLLDLAMPDFNGYDVIDSLEAKNMLDKNKIIIFTASNISEKELNSLINRGIHSYILKPIDIDELLIKIRKTVK